VAKAKLKRTGKCWRCGQCCTRLTLHDYRGDASPKKWEQHLRFIASFEGVSVHKLDDVWAAIRFEGLMCRYLAYSKTGLASCRLHKKNKPTICRNYPGTNSGEGSCHGGGIRVTRKRKKGQA